jgi:hypothetical protein
MSSSVPSSAGRFDEAAAAAGCFAADAFFLVEGPDGRPRGLARSLWGLVKALKLLMLADGTVLDWVRAGEAACACRGCRARDGEDAMVGVDDESISASSSFSLVPVPRASNRFEDVVVLNEADDPCLCFLAARDEGSSGSG